MKLLNNLIWIGFLCIILPEISFSQCFNKKDKIIDAGIKISIYKVRAPDDNDNNDDNTGAASFTIPVGFEYAVSNRIAAGVEIGFCNYFTGEDTTTGTIANAGSVDLLFKGDFHWLRSTRVDLYSGIGVGFSSFKYESNDSKNSKFNSDGFYLRLGLLNAGFYVSKSIALRLHVGIPYMNFENGRIKDDLGSDYGYGLDFTGIDIGTGIAFRF